MGNDHLARRNRILAATPQDVLARLGSDMEHVRLEPAAVLREPGGELKHAYFPLEGVVSLLCVLRSGAAAETAIIGREGVVGLSLCMGGPPGPLQLLVQGAGEALCVGADTFVSEFTRSERFRQRLLRYHLALVTQITQAAACHSHHTTAQQLCRWLLMMIDRTESTRFSLTQETIANMLGVGRPRVSHAASRLQKQGAIRYSRGRLEIVSRAQLEACTCECYGVMQNEYKRLLEP